MTCQAKLEYRDCKQCRNEVVVNTRLPSGLSARERNKLKRKSRALNRSASAEGSSKRSKSGNEAADAAAQQAEAEEDGQEWQAVAAGQWPFQGICDQMCIDVLDPVWEVGQLIEKALLICVELLWQDTLTQSCLRPQSWHLAS